MEVWDIKVLYLGKIITNLSVTWPAMMPPLVEDFVLEVPYLGFLLQNKRENIVVDTGISEKFIKDGKAWAGLPAEGGRVYLEKALAKAGVGPEEIGTVIYTHLHNDHAGNCGIFKRARIIFQKDEWLNLLNPLPVQEFRRDYDPDLAAELEAMNPLMVDGDMEIAEGLKLYKTPGHSLGSQSVAVRASKGMIVLIGDLCGRYHYLFPQLGEVIDMKGNRHEIPKAPPVLGSAVASSLIYDFYAFYNSIGRVKAIAARNEPGFLIPGHEPSLIWRGICES